ncbi:MAG: HAMP domain-containing histidine kinase [Paludibacteraceae bacterium]|nr:HAMP domain-containing histidine kinase [Paludibacteraceae bacterium]
MNKGQQVSLIYSAITISLVIVAGVIFFVLQSHYAEKIYFRYLEEKAIAVAMERFEKDELSAEKYRRIVYNREQSIPTSRELFINMQNRAEAESHLGEFLTKNEIEELTNDSIVRFHKDGEIGLTLVYDDNEGVFAVVMLSRNPYISEISKTFGYSLVLLVFATGIVLFLISRLYAIKVYKKIDHNYQTEKLFVNNASHEINNPLTAIQGECEVALIKTRTVDEYKQSLQKISLEAERVISIMKNLLLFSHTRSEHFDPDSLNEVNVGNFMQSFADDKTNIEVVNNFSIKIKEDLLRIAIRNIISNAHKYSKHEPVKVSVNNRKIIINDNGIGIPKDELKNITQPFYRASNTSDAKGAGIGLALSREILSRFNVDISFVSELGRGTSVVVDFGKIR